MGYEPPGTFKFSTSGCKRVPSLVRNLIAEKGRYFFLLEFFFKKPFQKLIRFKKFLGYNLKEEL